MLSLLASLACCVFILSKPLAMCQSGLSRVHTLCAGHCACDGATWAVLCRWVKNLNQGTDGAEVDDLLQLSYLQRLARQKVAEMEVSCPLPSSC